MKKILAVALLATTGTAAFAETDLTSSGDSSTTDVVFHATVTGGCKLHFNADSGPYTTNFIDFGDFDTTTIRVGSALANPTGPFNSEQTTGGDRIQAVTPNGGSLGVIIQCSTLLNYSVTLSAGDSGDEAARLLMLDDVTNADAQKTIPYTVKCDPTAALDGAVVPTIAPTPVSTCATTTWGSAADTTFYGIGQGTTVPVAGTEIYNSIGFNTEIPADPNRQVSPGVYEDKLTVTLNLL